MRIDILTLFPEMFKGPFDSSMLKKAQDKGLVDINIHNLRDWAKDKHKTVDDRPFGGGKGMVLMVEPVYEALKKLLKTEDKRPKTVLENRGQKTETSSQSSILSLQKQSPVLSHPSSSKIILLSPQGKVFSQKKAQQFSKLDQFILIAGHYEGFDERIRKYLIDEEISIGDYILTGGEIPAMVIVDSVVRLLPGVLDKEATQHESFSLTTHHPQLTALLDYPAYTRPENFKGWKVPKVLLSGNHAEIEKWRKKEAIVTTKKKRPDLIKKSSK